MYIISINDLSGKKKDPLIMVFHLFKNVLIYTVYKKVEMLVILLYEVVFAKLNGRNVAQLLRLFITNIYVFTVLG